MDSGSKAQPCSRPDVHHHPSDNDRKPLLRDLFWKLHDNVGPEENLMWQPFRKEIFTLDKDFLEKIRNEEQRQNLGKILVVRNQDFLNLKEIELDDNFWLKLILHTRDKACKPIDRARKSRVRLQGDADHEVCIDDIERRLIEELPDLFISQQCVPEVITFDQDKNDLIKKLKQRYDEISDSDDKKLVLAKSDLAKCLQRHVAEEAEAAVRTKIYEAARREKVPMVVLGGVKTAEHVGSHLEQFGISLTKLKSLLNPSKSEATIEVEHDVLVLAYHNNKVHITFVQVYSIQYIFHLVILQIYKIDY